MDDVVCARRYLTVTISRRRYNDKWVSLNGTHSIRFSNTNACVRSVKTSRTDHILSNTKRTGPEKLRLALGKSRRDGADHYAVAANMGRVCDGLVIDPDKVCQHFFADVPFEYVQKNINDDCGTERRPR